MQTNRIRTHPHHINRFERRDIAAITQTESILSFCIGKRGRRNTGQDLYIYHVIYPSGSNTHLYYHRTQSPGVNRDGINTSKWWIREAKMTDVHLFLLELCKWIIFTSGVLLLDTLLRAELDEITKKFEMYQSYLLCRTAWWQPTSIFAINCQIGVLGNRNLSPEGEHFHTKSMPNHKGVLEYLFEIKSYLCFYWLAKFWGFKLAFYSFNESILSSHFSDKSTNCSRIRTVYQTHCLWAELRQGTRMRQWL